MEAKELRIGNYVEGIGMEHPIRKIYDSIQYNYKTERYELDDIDIQYFKPIPLTEEWLKKFGFKKQKASGWHGAVSGYHPSAFYFISEDLDEFKQHKYRHNFVFTNVSERRFEPCYQYNGIRDKGLELKYVHQLQNLYFALTGEELKSKD